MISRISWAAEVLRPNPVSRGLCGFDKGRSLAIKQSVKSLKNPCVAKLNRKFAEKPNIVLKMFLP